MSEPNESKNIPSDFQKAVTWKAITGVSFAIIFLLLISSIFILGKFLNILQPVLVPVAIAAILSYLLSPLVHWIRKKALREHKLSRTRAILLVYSALTIFFTVIALMVIIPASSQLNELIQDREKIIKNAQKKQIRRMNQLALHGDDDELEFTVCEEERMNPNSKDVYTYIYI